jgi:mutator protein MutT
MTTVVAAIIEQDQNILVCQRKAGGPHAGKWEFPGGKVEAGESLEAALARELREELTIEAKIGQELARYEYSYPNKKPILLVFFEVRDFSGELTNQVFEQTQWSSKANLTHYDFLEGDADFLRIFTSKADQSKTGLPDRDSIV